jgi:GGDEF domain-containing protein
VAGRILAELQTPTTIDGRAVTVRVSVGIALSGRPAGTCGAGDPPAHAAGTVAPQDAQVREILHRADRAMYRAKSLGGGQWAVFDKDC